MTSFDGYDDPQEFAESPGRHLRRDIESDLRSLIELVANAKQMPLSNSALVPREDVLGLLEQALQSLPDEIREARWALRDREELMAAEMHKAQQLMDQVRAEAARMVDKTEIVRQSRLRSDQIIADAQTQARQMINQAEDFIDGKLGNFEIVLERLLKTAHSGRERLSAQGLPTSMIEPVVPLGEEPAAYDASYNEAPPEDDSSFFDQDAY
ncbi:MAG: DivIVA domain-containing protein [Acidimicrobiales bacterium]